MAQLIAGVASGDITPPLGVAMAGYGARDETAQAVADPLMAQALVLRSGDQSAAIVCTDLICVNEPEATAARQRAAELTGIPAQNIMICASHTHWGPVVSGGKYLPQYLLDTVSAEYRESLVNTLARLVADASAAGVPVTAGYGSGFADGITFNRRPVADNRNVSMHLVMDPVQGELASREGNALAKAWVKGQHKGPRLSRPLPELDACQAGVADAEVAVLRLQQADGTPLAGLVNFACHAVCGAGEDSFYHFSADFPGFARQAFTELIGAPMLFAAGCSGDQVPRWRREDARWRVGSSLGAEAARAWIATDGRCSDLPLAVTSRKVLLPLNPRVPDMVSAKAALAAHPQPDSTAAVTERAMIALREQMEGREGISAEIWAMRLGDLGIVGLPGEVLTEIGLQIKQRSPFATTMVVSLANDGLWYLPTDDAMREGGYEPDWTTVGPGTEHMLVQTGLELLRELS
jgi:neutral ceramidase